MTLFRNLNLPPQLDISVKRLLASSEVAVKATSYQHVISKVLKPSGTKVLDYFDHCLLRTDGLLWRAHSRNQ